MFQSFADYATLEFMPQNLKTGLKLTLPWDGPESHQVDARDTSKKNNLLHIKSQHDKHEAPRPDTGDVFGSGSRGCRTLLVTSNSGAVVSPTRAEGPTGSLFKKKKGGMTRCNPPMPVVGDCATVVENLILANGTYR